MPPTPPLQAHHAPMDFSDRFAWRTVRFLRFLADIFFASRYGNRAVVLETIAAVPGMVGGALQHLRSLRRMRDDEGWIRKLLDEAENERMHLMTFVHIAKPSALERWMVLIAQGIFYNLFSCCTWFLRAPPTGWSATLRKKRSTAIPNTWQALTAGNTKTWQRRKLPLTTGSWHPMHGCVM